MVRSRVFDVKRERETTMNGRRSATGQVEEQTRI